MKRQTKRLFPLGWPKWILEDLAEPRDPRQQRLTVPYLTMSGFSAAASGGTRTRPLYEMEEAERLGELP